MALASPPVLIFAPLAQDGEAIAELVGTAGFLPRICTSPDDLLQALRTDALCCILTEEGSNILQKAAMAAWQAEQAVDRPPFLFILSDADRLPNGLRAVERESPTAVLQRPIKTVTLQSALANLVALHQRQLEKDELLAKLEAAERRQRFLFTELDHRTMNALAIIQGMVYVTARSHTDVASFSAALEARIAALAKVHRQLSREGQESVSLKTIVEDNLRPQLEDSTQLKTDGPSTVTLNARLATDLALCLNELMTNAIKYGALSVPGGTVSVHWRREGNGVVLIWQETGGPEVSPPRKRSFGTDMIEGMWKRHDGDSRLEFKPDGVVWHCFIPVADLDGKTRPGASNPLSSERRPNPGNETEA